MSYNIVRNSSEYPNPADTHVVFDKSIGQFVKLYPGQRPAQAMISPEVVTIAASTAPYATRISATAYCTGTNDNTVIQSYLNTGKSVKLVGAYAAAGGALVPAQFNLGASLVLKFQGQGIYGEGMDATVLYLSNGVNDFAIKNTLPSGQSSYHFNPKLHDFTINANVSNNATGSGIKLQQTYFGDFRNLRVLNTGVHAVQIIGLSNAYAAYNMFYNCTVSVGNGNGITSDEYTEFNQFFGVNASYFQGGTPDSDYFDEPPTTAGIGLYLKGGNNVVIGGHYDRNRVGTYLEFSSGNRFIATGTDNSWDCAIAIKGSHRNVFQVEIGRCDPGTGSGGNAIPPSPAIGHLYGTRRAINIVNNSAGNVFIAPIFHPDNSPPTGIPGTSSQGGWRFGVGESSGAGGTAQGGRNVVTHITPYNVPVRFDGNSSPVKAKTTTYQITHDDMSWEHGGPGGILFGDAAAGGFTVTLPDADTAWTRRITVKNVGSTNNVTVAAGAGDSIAGGSVVLTPGQYCTIMGPQSIGSAPSVWQRIG